MYNIIHVHVVFSLLTDSYFQPINCYNVDLLLILFLSAYFQKHKLKPGSKTMHVSKAVC